MNKRDRNQRAAIGLATGFLIVAFLLVGCAAARPAGKEYYQGKEVAPNEVLVKFRGAPDQMITQAATLENADETEYVGSTQAVRFHSRDKKVETLIQELSARPDVEYVEPNYVVYALLTPDDPYFIQKQLYGLTQISAPAAWDSTQGSTDYVVGVVDTGIDYAHPDLTANVWTAQNAFSVTVSNGASPISVNCPANSHGFNAIAHTCDPKDDNNHGTHVSGTIGAVGNNGVGVVGVNWVTKIMALKFLNSQGSGYLSDAVEAIDFAIKAKQQGIANVRILSNSWGGGGFSQTLYNEIVLANQNDILFVAAAGNDGRNNDQTASYPSGYDVPNVVAVAASDSTDTKASFSNWGARTVDLAAPGVYILSTIPNNGYASYSGTSMATPHVSGAAALVLAACPGITTTDLKKDILDNVDKLAAWNGLVVTGGRLNVGKAVQACWVSPGPDFRLTVSPASQAVVPGGVTTFTVTVTRLSNFDEDVALSLTGLPANTQGTFSPSPIPNSGTSSILTISTTSTTPTGTYTLEITGTGTSKSHTATVTLNVGTPDFAISASPSSQMVYRGFTAATYTVTITPSAGFNSPVSLSISGLPSRATASFSPQTVTPPGTSTLRVTTKTNTPTGSYTLKIKGTSGSLSHTADVTLVVTRLFGIFGKATGTGDEDNPAGS